MSRMQVQGLLFLINLFCSFSLAKGIEQLELIPGLKCSYNYDLEVHAHRGERTTKELNFKVNAQVCLRFAREFLRNPSTYIFTSLYSIYKCSAYMLYALIGSGVYNEYNLIS